MKLLSPLPNTSSQLPLRPLAFLPRPAAGTNPRGVRPAQPMSLEVARAAFALLEKLDTGRRRPPPSIPKVFHLYCLDCLSAAQVARQCRCSKAAVIRRLDFIRRQTGLRPVLLRNLAPQPPSREDLLPSRKANTRTSCHNLLYADSSPDEDKPRD